MTPNHSKRSRLRTFAMSLATAVLGATALSAAAQANDSYTWVRQSTPPANAVTPPGRTDRALCRATDNRTDRASNGSYWLGWFDGTNCQVWYAHSEVFPAASTQLEFLVPAPGRTTHWIDMGPHPQQDYHRDALSGGYSDYQQRVLDICSSGGGIGFMIWEYGGYSHCETNPPGHPAGYPPIYKLVGTIR
jgi:hypothetical protein